MSYNNLAWCMPQNSLKVLGGTVSFAPLMDLWFAMITGDNPSEWVFLLQKLTSKIFLHEIFRDNFIFCTDANRPLLNYSEFLYQSIQTCRCELHVVHLLLYYLWITACTKGHPCSGGILDISFLVYDFWFIVCDFGFQFLISSFWNQISEFSFLKIRKQLPTVFVSFLIFENQKTDWPQISLSLA